MRRLMILAVAALTAAVLVPLAPTSAGAGGTPTTDVYVLHGLNLGGQTSPDDGGTAVTVCSGDTSIEADFQFGDILGPLPLDSGVGVPVQVYPGADEDCAAPFADPLIDTTVTPEGEAQALVATAGPDEGPFELLPFDLNVSCYQPGFGLGLAAHAAAAPPVVLLLDGDDVVELAYGSAGSDPLPTGTYDIAVVLGDTVLIDRPDDFIEEGVLGAVFVVGNQPIPGAAPSPVVGLDLDIPLELCAAPVTTAAPTTTAAAAPAAAQPRFTG